jgi:cell volume regulation protein A
VLAQGTTIPFVARRLGITGASAGPEREVSFDTVITGDDGPQLHEITVEPDAPAVGRQLVDLALPAGVLVVLVQRGPESFMPQGSTVIAAGDGMLIAAERTHRHRFEALFRDPTTATEERSEPGPT